MIHFISVLSQKIDNLGVIHADCIVRRDNQNHHVWVACCDGEYSIQKFLDSTSFERELAAYAELHGLTIKDI